MVVEKISSVKNSTSENKNSSVFTLLQNRAFQSVPADSVAFSGSKAKAANEMKDVILDFTGTRWMDWIHSHMGEIQNQLINAIGTGMVAPLFIKYNPLSNTDKDTRTYTAWRQPVSAVLAICTQAAIVIPFNKLIKQMADTGAKCMSVACNASLSPSDDYLRKEIKKENPGKSFTKEEMEAALSQKKKEYATRLEQMISKDGITMKQTDFSGNVTEIKMSEENFKKLFEDTLDSIIEGERTERDNALNQKLAAKRRRAIFYNEHPEEARNVIGRIEQIIQESSAGIGEDSSNGAAKTIKDRCKELIKEIEKEAKTDKSKKTASEELIRMVKDVRERIVTKGANGEVAIGIIRSHVQHMRDEVNIVSQLQSTEEIGQYVQRSVYHRTEAIDGVIKTLTDIKERLRNGGITVEEAQKLIDERTITPEEVIRKNMKAKGLKGEAIDNVVATYKNIAMRLKQKAPKIATSIAEEFRRQTKSNIEGLTRWTGLASSLAILPFTCWLLNRIYPWFMDRAFPELSNKQAKKAEAKKAAQKAEVK